MSKHRNNNSNLLGKPRKCDLSDPEGTQKKACKKRRNGGGMLCKNCNINKKYY